LVDLLMLRRDIRGDRQFPPVVGFPEVFLLAHIGDKVHLIQIRKEPGMAAVFKAPEPTARPRTVGPQAEVLPDKAVPHVPGQGVFAGMGVDTKDLHKISIALDRGFV
jgi:hypothetical protein